MVTCIGQSHQLFSAVLRLQLSAPLTLSTCLDCLGFAALLSSPSLSSCVLSVTSDYPPLPCHLFLPSPLLCSSRCSIPSMLHGWHQWQGPRNPIQAAANYANAHPWQEIDWASPGAAYAPLVDPWIEQPCCGDPVCVRTTMEHKSTVDGEATERGPPAVPMPSPPPLRVDFHWVPGSDPGTFDGSPLLLNHFLVQLGDYMSSRFKHYQDNLSCVCKVLRRLTGQARAWAAPYLDGDLPLPDDYEHFCQDLKEVIEDPNNFAEYHAAVPCPLPPASGQPPVAPQLPVVRQYLAKFSDALALNMGPTPRPVPATLAMPAVPSSDSAFRIALPEQQLAKESSPGPAEPPALSTSACGTKPGLVGPASSQPREGAPKSVLVLPESANPLALKLDLALPGSPESQKTEEEVSEAEGDQEASLDDPQGAVETPGEPPFSPALSPATLGCKQGSGSCSSGPCVAKELHSPPSGRSGIAR
ncbi:LOW QUALITY PROTEIN: protein Bop [Sturnira hondurensis]|uniref:LOW QUALITY PROTEIN: protein Bop n=1 Tax=Sturnira hondurensis TaxID=192404 RepID=UPI00187B09FE|nr:LOW QUALITY PROTEIN: protein Bop [Sturnira hondurensis]